MKFKSLCPMIWTPELTATIDFYTKTLGFICRNRNDEWGWATMQKDGVEIMITKPNEHTPFNKPLFTGSFYINTDSVNTLWEQLKNKVKVAYPIDDFEYGMREFAIYDNNGYMLQFGQDLKK